MTAGIVRYIESMMPGAHLLTAVGLGGAAYLATGSIPAGIGCFTGGFLIDVDHYFDYLFIEKQWHRPMPQSFLRYYFDFQPTRLVLPLHSWELLTLMIIAGIVFSMPWLIAYVVGALMHLFFDILINGEHALKQPVKFYSLAYRAAHGFRADRLLEISHAPAPHSHSLSSQFWSVRPPAEQDSPSARRRA
jgi:hypothetical protein